MGNKMSNILISVAIILILQTKFNTALGQNSGVLNFSVTTNRTYVDFDPKNIVAIWITDDNGNFIQTLTKRAQRRQQYLYKWIANSNLNTVNAVTGATLSSHQTHAVTWNCIDISGNIVPDGWYRIHCEFTTYHSQGPWTPVDYIRFYKGATSLDTIFSDYNYNNQAAFSGISLNYASTVNDVKLEYADGIVNGYYLHQNYPNPFNPVTNIVLEAPSVDHEYANIELTIFNSLGQLIKNLYIGKINGGVYTTTWDGLNNFGIQQPSGLYFLKLNAGTYKQMRKMVLMR